MANNNSAAVESVFQALSDPTRLAVVQQLAGGPASVKELAASFEMALPSFMKHLAVLENNGLVTSTKVGRVRTCRLDPQRLETVAHWFDRQRERWEAQTDRLAAYVEAQMGEGERK